MTAAELGDGTAEGLLLTSRTIFLLTQLKSMQEMSFKILLYYKRWGFSSRAQGSTSAFYDNRKINSNS